MLSRQGDSMRLQVSSRECSTPCQVEPSGALSQMHEAADLAKATSNNYPEGAVTKMRSSCPTPDLIMISHAESSFCWYLDP